MQRNSEPGDEHPKERGKEDVTGAGQRRYARSFCSGSSPAPVP